MNKKDMKPESLMMSWGYYPEWSEGAVKPPVFETSTFTFTTAEHGKAFFELSKGVREPEENEIPGLIYSRINNPNLEILEKRLCLWDGTEECAVFSSGMAAIATSLLELLKPGDLFVYGTPVYGGTDHFIETVLPKFGIHTLAFRPDQGEEEIEQAIRQRALADKLAVIFVETPANPTNHLIDIAMCARLAERMSEPNRKVHLVVDNTYMGPLWQKPAELGADLVLYSATKYLGGHSDLIAGAVSGREKLVKKIKKLRGKLGTMASPHTSWLLTRSLETLKLRMEAQGRNAVKVAEFLRAHPLVEKVYYLGFLDEGSEQGKIYRKQLKGPGAMLAFDIAGGEREAFRFLNELTLIKLAVSLGGTESLAEHPFTMTHAGVDPSHSIELGITEKMVRLSVGVEDADDLIADIEQALSEVASLKEKDFSNMEA